MPGFYLGLDLLWDRSYREVIMDNDLLLKDVISLYEIEFLTIRLLNRIDSFNKRTSNNLTCRNKLNLLIYALNSVLTKEICSNNYCDNIRDQFLITLKKDYYGQS